VENNSPAPRNQNDAAKPARVPTKEQQEELSKYYARINARDDFLRKVAQHDAQLALDMLRSTRQGLPPNMPGASRFDQEAALEQEFTFQAAASDPKRALQIAHESLAKGVSYQVLNLLREVNQKDQDAGTQLAGDIIEKLKTENLNATNSFAAFMVESLLRSSSESGAVLVATHDTENPSITRLKLADQQRQDLVFLLTDAALSATSSANVLRIVQWMMPEIQQYAPDRIARLKARTAEYNQTLPPQQRFDNFNGKFDNATTEEMIHAAKNVPDDQRGALFYLASSKAIERGETEKFRELIGSEIDDESARKAALDALDMQQIDYDLAQGKTDDLQKLLPLIRVKEQRAIAMAQLALLLEKKDQHEEAVKLLDQARDLVKVNLTDNAQSNALLAVMYACAQVDPPKAFAMIEPIIDRTNDELAKLLLLDKIVKSGATKNGELILNQQQFPLDSRMMQYSAGVVALGKADFERTKSLVDRFQRNELKVAGKLMLAKALLRDAESGAK
jgi:tetratricopeptide (TPR) repeat protein